MAGNAFNSELREFVSRGICYSRLCSSLFKYNSGIILFHSIQAIVSKFLRLNYILDILDFDN